MSSWTSRRFAFREFEERRKGFKRCDCPIFGAGTINNKRVRQSTGTWELDEARLIVASWEGRPLLAVPELQLPQRITLEDALEEFYTRALSKDLLESTLKKYRTFKNQFLEYADEKGIVYVDQLTIADADRFFTTVPGKARTKGNKLGMLRSFVKFALKRKWLKENIVEDLEAPRGVS